VPAPAFAEARRGEQAIDDFRERIFCLSSRKARISSGVGGSPLKAKVARRSSVRRSASPTGFSFVSSSLAS
jgi:hypothetical protein